MMELLEPEIAVPEPVLSDQLNTADRCDQCGAQAFVWVNMPNSKAGLLFCAHHYNRNEEKLLPVALHVVDERWKINTKPSPSPN